MKNYKTFYFADDGVIPNSHLPVIVYYSATGDAVNAEWFEKKFKQNNWTNNWRDIILTYDHFHSNTHEVLAVGSGNVTLQIGGSSGQVIELSVGNVLIIPAGVGHCAISNQTNYQIVGGYPDGNSWDLCTGLAEERKQVLENIAKVGIPTADPIFGSYGMLLDLWK
jgi:uncharacterized protein YjlB